MKLDWRRIRAIARKELADYRRNRGLMVSMAILPLLFMIQPLIAVTTIDASASSGLAHEHVLLYMLGIPALVPTIVAAYAIAGERQQGALEPILTTPIRHEELLLGKAIAALGPSMTIAYVVFALYLGLVAVLAQPGVASALIRGPDLVAQLVFTPLLATWSIWVGMAVSVRAGDVRVAQQLGILASLPPVFIVVLIAVNIIPASLGLGLGAAGLLLVLDGLGWRIVARLFDRERLVAGMR